MWTIFYDAGHAPRDHHTMTQVEQAAFETSAQIARLAALGDIDGLLRALGSAASDLGPDGLATALGRYQLGPMVRQTLAGRNRDLSAGSNMAALFELLRPIRISPRELLKAYVALSEDLARVGIPVLLLKGAVLAELLYGDVERRPQYDIDVLVRKQDTRRARGVLASAGYRKRRRDGHSISFAREKVHVDLHHALRSAPAYTLDESRLWRRERSAMVAGHEVRTLSDDDTLAFLAMSVVEDVGFGMQKLKNLCDIWLLIRMLDGAIDWDEWFSIRSHEHVERMAVNGCTLALLILGSPHDAPNLSRALESRRGLVRLKDRAHTVTLMTNPRGSPANMAWFGEVYPGSLLRFRIHSFVTGWPETLREIRPRRVALEVGVLRARRAARNVDPRP
jgi:hypothetical protein